MVGTGVVEGLFPVISWSAEGKTEVVPSFFIP